MTSLKTAAQQALEALEAVYGESCDAIHALRAALAQPMMCRGCGQAPHLNFPCAEIAALVEPKPEPVAWMDRHGDLYKMPEIEDWAPPHTMLYPAPFKEIPLTRQEIDEEWRSACAKAKQAPDMSVLVRVFARLIEKAHGIE